MFSGVYIRLGLQLSWAQVSWASRCPGPSYPGALVVLGLPLSWASSLQMAGLHSCVSQSVVINLSVDLHISYWFCLSGDPYYKA